MNHVATITIGNATYRPFHIQCVCGTSGDFGGKQEAIDWMARMHFSSLGGINTAEIQDSTPAEPEVAPAESE